MQYNDMSRKGYGKQAKRKLAMDEIESYIDHCLIDEYADKDFYHGYTLDVDSLSEHEKANFLDLLMRNDTSVRDLIHHHMQKLIDDRLPECEAKDRQNAGFTLIHLSNGDVQIRGEKC